MGHFDPLSLPVTNIYTGIIWPAEKSVFYYEKIMKGLMPMIVSSGLGNFCPDQKQNQKQKIDIPERRKER